MLQSYILPLMTSSWLNINDWHCARRVLEDNFPEGFLDIYTNQSIEIPQAFTDNRQFYLSHGSYKKRDYPCINIFVFDILPRDFRNIYGPVIVITRSFENVSVLWQKSKVLDIIVLEKTHQLSAYTWYPYEVEDCHKETPSLRKLATCQDGSWKNSEPIVSRKIPRNFMGCPLKVTKGTCVGLLVINGGEWAGTEQNIINSLADHFNLSLKYVLIGRENFFMHIDAKGQPGGGIKLLNDQIVDLAAGCMGLVGLKYKYADFLYPHVYESITWFVPTPRLKSKYDNIYSGFLLSLWLAIAISYFSFVCVFILLGSSNSRYKSVSLCFLNSLSNLIGWGTKLERGLAQTVLTMINFYALHLISFYESTILVHLFRASFESPIETPWEGLKAGLRPIIRFLYSAFLRNSDESFMKAIYSSGNYEIAMGTNVSYDSLLYDKASMFLSLRYVDEATIKLYHHGFDNLVKILDPPFHSYPYCIYLSPGNPLAPIFQPVVAQLIEGGFVYYWLQYYLSFYDNRLEKVEKFNSNQNSIAYETLQSTFHLLAMGLGVSIMIFLFEKLFYCLKQS